MFKEYYAISDTKDQRFIILQDDETEKFAVLKTTKPEIIEHLKKLNYKNANFAAIYEFGNDYIIEELLDGEKITDKIGYEEISISKIKNIISDICTAAKELHKTGIAHMDISTENIIEVRGKYFLIDYSAATKIGKRVSHLSHGTPAFCSPEHYCFDDVSEASDVYSIGKLLDYLLQLNCTKEERQNYAALIDEATQISKKDRIKNSDEFLEKFKNVCCRHTKSARKNDMIAAKQKRTDLIALSTQDIFNSMSTLDDLDAFIRHNKNNFINISVEQYFAQLIAGKKLKKADIIKASGIERTYGYQILNGTKKPSRNKMIALCIGASLTLEEVQIALKHTGFMPLYPRVKRDAIIIYGIKSKKKIYEIDVFLDRFGESPFSMDD